MGGDDQRIWILCHLFLNRNLFLHHAILINVRYCSYGNSFWTNELLALCELYCFSVSWRLDKFKWTLQIWWWVCTDVVMQQSWFSLTGCGCWLCLSLSFTGHHPQLHLPSDIEIDAVFWTRCFSCSLVELVELLGWGREKDLKIRPEHAAGSFSEYCVKCVGVVQLMSSHPATKDMSVLLQWLNQW